MKRLFLITCCFLVFVAGVAAAWDSCTHDSNASHKVHHSSIPAPAHNHHSGANQEPSHNTVIHCPGFSEFVPTATFSASKDHRVERVILTIDAELDSQFTQHDYRLIHGPPGLDNSTIIPPYLLLSVLRI
jgi:hypothetical protein